MELRADDIAQCRAIHKYYGKNYYYATRFLSGRVRDAVHVLYAWVRVPDEIVDNPANPDTAAKELERWIQNWKAVWYGGHTDDPVLRAAKQVFVYFAISEHEQQAFLAAMQQDLHKEHYQTYDELKDYMYGSAAVVGIMFSKIVGCPERVLPDAELNGYAMQLTNFYETLEKTGVIGGGYICHKWNCKSTA